MLHPSWSILWSADLFEVVVGRRVEESRKPGGVWEAMISSVAEECDALASHSRQLESERAAGNASRLSVR